MVKKYALPSKPLLVGFREMTKADVPQVGALLRKYMARFDIVQTFEKDEEVEHWFLSGRGTGERNPGDGQGREGQVIWTYVVEVSCILSWSHPISISLSLRPFQDPATHSITDMVSFYSLPSLVMKHEKHRDIHTAYAFYYASDVLFSPGGSDEDASKQKDRLAVRLNELMKDAMIIAKQVSNDFVG